MVCVYEAGGVMTNREMAIRLAAATIEKMLAGEDVDAKTTLEVLKTEIEVFDLIQSIRSSQ